MAAVANVMDYRKLSESLKESLLWHEQISGKCIRLPLQTFYVSCGHTSGLMGFYVSGLKQLSS